MHRIVHSPKVHQRIRRSLQLAALEPLLSDHDVEAICTKLKHPFRHRQLPPGVLLRSMVYRGLHPDHSIAALLSDLAARLAEQAVPPTESAWCQARTRLPEQVLVELIHRQARSCRCRFAGPHRWHNRWLFRIDGSTVSMPDEPALVEAFGYTNTRHGRSRFPVARVSFIELAGLNVIWDYRMDAYRCSEEQQLGAMWPSLPAGCMCLLDRKFCSFYVLAKLRQRGIGALTPLHQRRDPWRLIGRGCALGKDDWLVPLDLCPQLRREYQDPMLPKELWVRVIRVRFWRGNRRKTLWLVTTLLDPDQYPAAELGELYRDRWPIETRIGELKTTLEMNVLRSKSPAAVRREVGAIILGHNLVWTLMHEAAELTDTPAEDISFAGAVKTALAFSGPLRQSSPAARRQLHQQMLLHIARHTNHHPFGRVEPRLLKRETARFAYLREPRWKARLKCLS
ncbi:MAG: IS4 family transposase [Planctomycetota bacterium]